MEEPPNAIRFDQTQDTRFFLCRHCKNHVLSLDNCFERVEQVNGIICKDPVNVRVDEVRLRWFLYQQPVVNVSCNECNKNLGQKFIMAVPPNNTIVGGKFIFYPNRMMYWNGTRLVYADTNKPVPDN